MTNKPTYEELEKKIKELEKAVAESRQAEKVPLESEEYHRLFVDTMHEGMAVQKDQILTYVNDAFCKMLGYSRDELIGKEISSLFAGEGKEELKNQMAKRRKGIAEPYENTLIAKDGGKIHTIISPHLWYNEGNIYHGSLAIFTDITDRKLIEERLLRIETLMNSTQQLTKVGGWEMELETGRTFWTDEVYRIHGLQPGELSPNDPELAKLSMRCYDPKDLPMVMQSLSELILTGKSYDFEFLFTIPKGQKWIRTITEAVWEGDKIVKVVGSFMDITEQKQAAEQRAKLEEQLRQSQKMESIGTLAGGIAHDFNNFFGVIVGNTEIAFNDVPDWNPAHHNLEEIHKAALRARDMVKQILRFSRQTKNEAKPVRICPIMEDALDFVRSTIPVTIEIRTYFSAPADTILADPTQLNQIIMNLCTNAAHAMREKGGLLEIGLKNINLEGKDAASYQDLVPGKYLVLTVSDTGQGIEPELCSRIFDPYYTTKGVGDGTGLGLSVVHGIVKSYHGAIHVFSEPGKGTTLKVFFPLIESKIAPEATSLGSLPTGKERILFVDDQAALAEIGGQMLKSLGYEVTVRTSSNEALEVFREQPDKYDLLLTDMTMPEMTGKDLAQEFLRLRPDFPIILCTGFSEIVSEESAQQIGIKAFVMKPIIMRELAETVRQVLDLKDGKHGGAAGRRILLVEDDEQLRGMLRQMLEGAGHDVEEAPDGKIGAKLFREKPADLIITDMIMPEKEGLEMIMELWSDFPDVKIIAMSGGGMRTPEEYLKIARHMGALYTFEKPFNKQELLAAVQDVLNK